MVIVGVHNKLKTCYFCWRVLNSGTTYCDTIKYGYTKKRNVRFSRPYRKCRERERACAIKLPTRYTVTNSHARITGVFQCGVYIRRR